MRTLAVFLLYNNRYDVFVGATRTCQFNFQRLGCTDGVTRIPIILDTIAFYLCVGKTSPHVNLLDPFGNLLQRMKQSGKLQGIHKRYE